MPVHVTLFQHISPHLTSEQRGPRTSAFFHSVSQTILRATVKISSHLRSENCVWEQTETCRQLNISHRQMLELKVKCMCCSATEEKEAMQLQ